MTEKPIYLQFPLYLTRDLLVDKAKAINKMITYGIYKYSLTNAPTEEKAARQLLYDYHNDRLPGTLHADFQSLIDSGELEIFGEYRGFGSLSNEFAEEEIPKIINAFGDNPGLCEEAFEHYRLHAITEAGKPLRINVQSDTYGLKQEALRIERGAGEREPYPMVSKALLFEFRDNPKTEFESALFAAYIGIRSILGTKQFCKTNYKMILARMFGYSTDKAIKSATLPPVIAGLYEKFNNRYHRDRVMRRLETDWHIITYSRNMRGLWVGKWSNKTSREDALKSMITAAEASKQGNKEKQIKQQKNEIRDKVLQQLKLV